MKLQQFELVADLRDFLSDQIQTCTVTNYRLIRRDPGPKEEPINDFSEMKAWSNSRNVQLVLKRGKARPSQI